MSFGRSNDIKGDIATRFDLFNKKTFFSSSSLSWIPSLIREKIQCDISKRQEIIFETNQYINLETIEFSATFSIEQMEMLWITIVFKVETKESEWEENMENTLNRYQIMKLKLCWFSVVSLRLSAAKACERGWLHCCIGSYRISHSTASLSKVEKVWERIIFNLIFNKLSFSHVTHSAENLDFQIKGITSSEVFKLKRKKMETWNLSSLSFLCVPFQRVFLP